MESEDLWGVTPCRLVVSDVLEERSAPTFRIKLPMLFLKMEALGFSEMSA
jgi:hypothetical protein